MNKFWRVVETGRRTKWHWFWWRSWWQSDPGIFKGYIDA